jgi:PAS domain S-box-containing protein
MPQEKPSYEDLQKRVLELEKIESENELLKSKLNEQTMEAEQLRYVLDHVSSYIYLKDSRFRYVYANRPTLELFGCSAEELVGSDDSRFFPPETVQQIREIDIRVLSGEHTAEEVTAAHIQGDRHVYWEVKNPIYAQPESNIPTGILGISTDITERKKSKEKIHESWQFVQYTLDALSSNICVLDEAGKILLVNEAWRRFAESNPPTNKSVQVGANYLAVCDSSTGKNSEGAAEFAYGIRQVMSGKQTNFSVEYPCHSPTEKRWFIGRVTRFSVDGPARVVVSHSNITERKLVEESLAEKEYLYRQLVESMYETMSVIDADGKFLFANHQTISNMSCKLPEDILGKNIREFLPLDQAETFIQNYQDVITTQKVLQQEVLVSLPNRDAWFLHTLQPIQFGPQKIPAVLSLSLDFSPRKQAEEKLRESETFIRTIMDNLPIGVAVNTIDPSVRFEYMNDKFPQFYRTTRDALLEPGAFWDVVYENPDFREELKKKVVEDCASGDPERMRWEDIPIARNSEDTTFITATNTHIPGKNLMISTVWDVTDRKRMEEALRKSELHYRSLFDNSLDAFLFTIPNGGVVDANPAACTLFGRTVEEIRILGRDGLVDTTDPRLYLALEERARTGRVKAELRMIRSDGTKFPVEASSVIFKDLNGTENTSMVIRDITDRKLAEEALVKREKLLQSIFQAAPIGICVTNNRILLDINDRFCEMTGYERPEIIGRDIRFLYPDDVEYQSIGNMAYGMIREHGSGTVETKWKCNNGRIIDVLMNFASINVLDLDEGVTITALDITAHNEADRDKQQLQTQLLQAQKMEAIGRLAGGVAHDFNNMLNVILGYTELAMEKSVPGDPIQADLKEVLSAAQHSSDITRQLLAFARKQVITPKRLDLNSTVEGMLKILRRLIGEDIDLVWFPGKQLWKVVIDPSQLDQILANLCVNARDAISGVGKIVIETRNMTLDTSFCAEHPWCEEGEFVLLCVTDNGHGMDKVTVDQIFEPFFSTKEMGRGTGLGLATVYGIVKQNGGFIHVYSEPNKGTTFRIYLPRDPAPSESSPEEPVVEIPLSHGETILVVEDAPPILQLVESILQGLGYNVLKAGSPIDALNLAETFPQRIDMLITDIVMPKMDGRQLYDRVLQGNPEIKCLFMSGYTTDEIIRRGILDEKVNFISKPFSKKELAAKVREVLDKK